MRTRQCGKGVSVWIGAMVFVIGIVWLSGGRALGEDAPPLYFQGIFMERQGERLVINERTLLMTKTTQVLSMDKKPVSASRLVPGQWVAVEAVPTLSGPQVKTIYLLPQRQNSTEMLELFTDESE